VNQAFQFAMIGFDYVIQVFELSVNRLWRAYAFLFQNSNGGPIGALSVLITRECTLAFIPLRALPKNRLAALIVRVGERKKSIVCPCLSIAR